MAGFVIPGTDPLGRASDGMRGQIRSLTFGVSNGSRMPIVSLPGFGVSRYLHESCGLLARRSGRQVLLVEPPGFGANADVLPASVTVPLVADRLRPWLSAMGPVLLLGQSTGCLVAARLARAAAGLEIGALAVVSPVFDPASATLGRAARGLLVDGMWEPWWLGPMELPEWVRNARALPTFLRSCLSESLEEHLDTARCPVVIVRGGLDPLSRHEWVARLGDNQQRTLVSVPGGSHTFIAARPAVLADSLAVGRFGETVAS
jgi:pimeloyl-ACP methyl ester carboxylesterase